MAGGGATIKAKRLNGVVVQGSVAGAAITKFWGTQRVPASLLWYGGFKSISHKKKQGGKGGGSVTQIDYTYTASVILGIAAGPISGVRKVWRDKSVWVDGGTTALAQAKLSLAVGNPGQAVWGYLTTNFPSEAIGYSGIAYAYAADYDLNDSATLGNHSFEAISTIKVSGKDDANPGAILADFIPAVPLWPAGMIASLTDYENYCLAANLLLSPSLDAQRQASEFINEILMASNSDVVWSDGQLKIKPLGDMAITGNGVTWTPDLTPVYGLTDSDFIPSPGDDPVLIDLKRPADAYNYIKVEYLDRTNNYNPQVVPGVDKAHLDEFGRREKTSPYSLKCICETDIATTVAQLIVQRECYQRAKYRFRLPWNYCLLEPLDLVTLTTGNLVNVLVRIESFDETDDGDFEVVAEEMLVGTATAPAITRQENAGYASNLDVAPGNVSTPVIINPPRQLTQAGGYEVWAAVGSTNVNWGGCEVWTSLDDATYELAGNIVNGSRFGVTTSSMGAVADPDTTTVLGVNLATSLGELQPATQDEVDDYATLCLIDSEVIAYRDAALTSAHNYDLDWFHRGLFGTTVASHSSGAPFVRIDETLFVIPYREDQIGKTIYVKFRSYNIFERAAQDLSLLSAYSFTLNPSAATFVDVYARVQYIDNTGRIVDGRGMPVNGPGGAAMTINPTFPLSSTTDSSITSAGCVIDVTNQTYTVPSGSITGLASDTPYAVFWDLDTTSYVAISGSAASYYVDPARYLAIGIQRTQLPGGGFTPPAPPPGGGGGYCPAPDTPILMADMSRRLAGEIVEGDEVWTKHEESGAWGAWPVTAVSTTQAARVALILTDGRRLVATPLHRVLTGDGAWVSLIDLRPGALILGTHPGIVASVEAAEGGPAVRISVAGAATYVSDGILSHNVKPEIP